MRSIKINHFWQGLSLIWISHLMMDFMLGVWPVYKTIVHLDLVVAGLIVSIAIFLGEGLQLYFGYLSDKGYQQKLLALGIGLTATIPFLSYVENEWVLFIMLLSAYVGSGAFHPSGTGLLFGGETSQRSFLIAFFAFGGMIGAASSQILYSFLYDHLNGETWFLVIPIVLCFIGCASFSFSKVDDQKVQTFSFKQLMLGIKPVRNQLILLYVINVCLQIVLMSFTFLLPEVLEIKGYEKWFCLGGGYFCFIIGSVLTSLPIGYVVGKIGYKKVLAAIVIASCCLLYLFLELEALSLNGPISILLLLGGTLGVIIPVVVAGGVQAVPAHTRSFVSALYMGGTTCLAGFGPILAGLLASNFDENAPVLALKGLNAFFIISLILLYFLPSPNEKIISNLDHYEFRKRSNSRREFI